MRECEGKEGPHAEMRSMEQPSESSLDKGDHFFHCGKWPSQTSKSVLDFSFSIALDNPMWFDFIDSTSKSIGGVECRKRQMSRIVTLCLTEKNDAFPWMYVRNVRFNRKRDFSLKISNGWETSSINDSLSRAYTFSFLRKCLIVRTFSPEYSKLLSLEILSKAED